jgi:hypothetical protein
VGALQRLSDEQLKYVMGLIETMLKEKESAAGEYGGESPPEVGKAQ